MSIAFSTKLEGMAELEGLFDSIDPKKQKRIMNKSLRAGGKVFQAAIVERAPERVETGSGGDALPPGALKNDIQIRITTDDRDLPCANVGPGKYTNHVANFVEYGHAIVRGGYSKLTSDGKRRGPGKVIGDVPEHPFIRPAYEESVDAAAEAFAVTFAEEVKKVAPK